MTKSTFKDKYPIFSLELNKSEVKLTSVEEILNYLKSKIEEHPVATFIATFNHYAHTSSLPEAKIAPEIKDAQNIIFCFGKEIPASKVLAVRPRSIGVCELEDKFVIEFMEAPNEVANETMANWAKGLISK